MLVEVLAFVVILVLLYVAVKSTGRPKGMPPGPTPLPIIGNFLEVIKWTSKNQMQIEFTKAAKKYGNIFTVDIPGDRTVVVNSASIAREACLTKKDDFAGRPYKFTWDYLTRGSIDIAIGDFTPTLILQRKLVHSALRNYNPHLVENVEKEADKLSKRLKSHAGNPVDPAHDFLLTTVNVICAMVYGEHYEIDDPEFLMILDYNTKMFRLLSAVHLLNIFPFLIHFPIKDSKDIELVRVNRDRLLDTKLHEHRETYQDGVIRDLTDALIKALQEAQKEDSKVRDLITENHVVMTMTDAFSGGLETTMTSLRWYCAYMVLNPDIQAKVHAELDDVVGRDVMPKWEDKSRLPYLEATIAETLRMSCVAALAVPHKASVDSTLAGYKIPKGTTLLLNIWAMHYDENEWKSPHLFDPTRFLDDEGKFLHGSGTKSYLPFGAGRRVCIGEALAKQELFIVISRLMHQFRIESPPGCPPPERIGYMGLVHMPKPYKICFKERVLKN
ncbi:steroid 17-alpha-hydroxylase/17,20 lyase-like [Actinia tenebrosa]|uniref:Steroid 21-hydroxylase n=1 Tax=Actinia tenebrosa TaxID=6105 RepID=A0A6P8H6G0_ACTTE|nr:steroid 17-alpha-hydroxylase/17,20 lyase-like [Actinia tenebrosa]